MLVFTEPVNHGREGTCVDEDIVRGLRAGGVV